MGNNDDSREGSTSSNIVGPIEKTLEYHLDTISDDLNDCRLQIRPKHFGKARWYRERSLNLNDEIEDKLICARTGKVIWSSFRPTAGWYIYIKSPIMPREAAVPLVPAKDPQCGGTPLSFSVSTTLDDRFLHKMTKRIDDTILTVIYDAAAMRGVTGKDERFTAVALDTYERDAQVNKASVFGSVGHARSTSRNLSQTFARHRSSGQKMVDSLSARDASRSLQAGDVMNGAEDAEHSNTGAGLNKVAAPPSNPVASEPSSCRFILTDDWCADSIEASGSWSSWAISLLPAITRASFKKQFSLLWLDAPQSASETSSFPIEVLRYEDYSSWSTWRGKRQGRFLLQHNAIRALGIDIGFWIAVALAYVEYIDERDGYHAAMDG